MKRLPREWSILHVVCCAMSFSLQSPAHAQPESCLADINAAASGDLGYKYRDSRCEGALKRFVGSSPSIDLIGYHYGTLRLPSGSASTVPIVAYGDGRGTVYLRALSLTSRSRYQMDHVNMKFGEPFPWPIDVLDKAAKQRGEAGVNASNIGLAVCSNRCADRPETIYWPVGTAPTSASGGVLSLVLHAGVRAVDVHVQLKGKDGKVETVDASKAVLTPDGVTQVALPDSLRSGSYELEVTAKDFVTRETLDALFATIYIPGKQK
jgi:hypothetical protein